MAVVLDAYAVAGFVDEHPTAVRLVGSAIDSGHCYITTSSVIEAACIITDHAGPSLAEYWIGWLYTNERITILERSPNAGNYLDENFVILANKAHAKSGLTPAAASAAAAARRMNIPVLTDREKFRQLEEIGFCQVSWIK